MKRFLAVLAGLVCVSAFAQDSAIQRKEVLKAGDWAVLERKDPMTDKASCVGLHKGNWKIQAAPDALYVSLKGRGGVEAYILRIDEEPAKEMQLASSTEKELGSAVLKADFDRLMSAKRLRFQAITRLNSVVFEDISLDGFSEAVLYMKKNDC